MAGSYRKLDRRRRGKRRTHQIVELRVGAENRVERIVVRTGVIRDGWVEIGAWADGDEVTIRISDSGEGIPPGELRAVSQRFYRVDRARTPGQGGLGLGLAIVKHMVQYMGGTLDLRSREGVGTTVTITLPMAPST